MDIKNWLDFCGFMLMDCTGNRVEGNDDEEGEDAEDDT